MLRRNILIGCFASSLIIGYTGSTISNRDIALSQGEPAIKYDGQSLRQVKKYKPIPGVAKRKNPKGLARRTRPNGSSTNQGEVFIDKDEVKILPDGTNIYKNGTNVWANGTTVYPDGTTVYLDGITVHPDGTTTDPDGTPIQIEQQELPSSN
jgi:hypothetical protein